MSRIFKISLLVVAVFLFVLVLVFIEPSKPEIVTTSENSILIWNNNAHVVRWKKSRAAKLYEVRLNNQSIGQTQRNYFDLGVLEDGFYELKVIAIGLNGKKRRSKRANIFKYSNSEESYNNLFKTDNESNGLPIIEIASKAAIDDESYTPVSVSVYPSHSLIDRSEYYSYAGIKIRGQTSQRFAKKSYTLEIQNRKGEDKAMPLLGLKAESDWVLHGPFSDKSLIRNHLAYWMARQLSGWSPKTKFVELYITDNEAGQQKFLSYKGVYLLTEKIKVSKNRLNLKKLKRYMDNSYDISGGYLLELVPQSRVSSKDEPYFFIGRRVFSILNPKLDKINVEQRAWIRDKVYELHKTINAEHNDAGKIQLDELLDIQSAVNFWIVNEVAKNVDALYASFYLNKDRSKKFKFGPVWDFNLGFGNVNYSLANKTHGWRLNEDFWYWGLFKNPLFVECLKETWAQVRSNQLQDQVIIEEINRVASLLEKPANRNFIRWPALGRYVWPNPEPFAESYDEEIVKLKEWTKLRLAWIDAQIVEL